ncbi:DUF58 domain-containing protein [Oceanibacterium hippocampi]|uniref:DUF58 domain-containing protein n=1 Tax=Oceanibacterium hippocampi TaxID=745714 RepID=A0A1Y5S8H6_9PROT|nr:DUF58 domain-containing protein [Oceanibacterium hippocampi]SLN34750.1 hypothetical protein OCH7691_01359 [Oceanibacterium hippocampi]
MSPPRSPATTGKTLQHRADQVAAAFPPLLIAAERVAATVAQGVHGRRRVGPGETFWQFRRFQSGDQIRAIDWRRSARSTHYFIRDTEWEAAESVWLWRDGSPSMDYRSDGAEQTKGERATLILLAVAALLVRASEQFAMLGDDSRPRTGPAALSRLAVQLLRPQAGSPAALGLPRVEPLPRFSQALLVGDFLSPLAELDAIVRGYSARAVKGHIVQILDPAEAAMPFLGRTRFEGMEGEGDFLTGRAEALAGDYRDRLARHEEGLRTIARNYGWSYVRHVTDRPPESLLLALYCAMAEQWD